MTVSLGESRDLILKWKGESTPILVTVDSDDGFTFKFSGSIAELFPHGFVMVRYTAQPKMCADLTVIMLDASSFEYQDLREAPQEMQEKFEGTILGILAFKLKGSTIVLYELQSRS
jgi:hypothetical protein